jgi:hypothetical protein
MRGTLSKVAIAVILIAIGSSTILLAQSSGTELEGLKPYIPCRLEWLALEANLSGSTKFSREVRYSTYFAALREEDTILIMVRYLPDVDREEMNVSIDNARKLVLILAKSNGWDSWVKVKEDIAMLRDK